jgi:hypothetical protein
MPDKLYVDQNSRTIMHADGTPFLWIGCTAWGMTEWLTREEVDEYLDDRKSKGMNVVQLCFFWGKRQDFPTRFTTNPKNRYGFKAFNESSGTPDPLQPAIKEGGSPQKPNDYWDHVDYCINAIRERGMYAAVLPFWGRRYVNASHSGQSAEVFTLKNIFEYGRFLGSRYKNESHIIWVNGGDVKADQNGDFKSHYRLLAEGLLYGAIDEKVGWDEPHESWNRLLMTYHPDGTAMINSSDWFHTDPWLDFNMIETHIHRDYVIASIRQDLEKKPRKPTVLAEGHYEGITNNALAEAIHVRRQAYQSFFAGAAGFTYGGGFNEEGDGPLFSVRNNWKPLLDMPGAKQMKFLREFLVANNWHKWRFVPILLKDNEGEGELQKIAVSLPGKSLIYFPDNSPARISDTLDISSVQWFNTAEGQLKPGSLAQDHIYQPPDGFEDAVLILE